MANLITQSQPQNNWNNNRPGRNRGNGKGNNPNWNRPKNGKGARCFRCNELGHLKRDCKAENVRTNQIEIEREEYFGGVGESNRIYTNPWEVQNNDNEEEDEVPLQLYQRQVEEEESETERNTRINQQSILLRKNRYNAAQDIWYTEGNMIFGDMMQITELRNQVKDMIGHVEKNVVRINEIGTEERPKYLIVVKLGKYQVIAGLDSGAQITMISRNLAVRLRLKWNPLSQRLTLISADGNKQEALGVIENANLRI